MTKIVYAILAYKEPEQVARLVNRILAPSDFALVHFDTFIGERKFQCWKHLIEDKCSGKNVKVVSEFRCKYGAFGVVDFLLYAVKYFEKVDYDYFIDLTGDSYPLKSPEFIKSALAEEKFSFFENFKLPSKEWYKGGLERINKKYFFIPKIGYPFVWCFSLPRLRKELPCELEPYGGRGSLCLKKEHANYVTQFAEKNPQVLKFFRRVFAPDEMFFQTILKNSKFKTEILNEPVLYFDFSE